MLEEREVYTAIRNMAEKVGMLAEVIVPTVLKNKYTAWLEHIALHYKVGDCSKVLESIRGVGKNKVVTAVAAFNVAEYIVAHNGPVAVAKR